MAICLTMYTKQHIMSLKGSDNMATAPTQIRIDSISKNCITQDYRRKFVRSIYIINSLGVD